MNQAAAQTAEQIQTRCCIAGGGPAGMMLGFLLARAGVEVIVLEKHKDFLRDFRGDTIHPSTLELMYELGLLEEFLRHPHQEVRQIQVIFGAQTATIADIKLEFDHLIAFPAVLTVRHRIDEESPLFGMTPEDFQQQDIHIVASIVGVDTVIVAPVQSFGDYNYEQIEWNRRFVEIFDQNEEGQWTVDYARIDETEDVAPIQNLAKDQGEQAAGRNTILNDSRASA
jgi:FAD binding domain/Inward rectifier potassium channel C-terminal domain